MCFLDISENINIWSKSTYTNDACSVLKSRQSSEFVPSSLAWYVFAYRKHVTVIIVLLVFFFSRVLYASVEYSRILPLDKCIAWAKTLLLRTLTVRTFAAANPMALSALVLDAQRIFKVDAILRTFYACFFFLQNDLIQWMKSLPLHYCDRAKMWL